MGHYVTGPFILETAAILTVILLQNNLTSFPAPVLMKGHLGHSDHQHVLHTHPIYWDKSVPIGGISLFGSAKSLTIIFPFV